MGNQAVLPSDFFHLLHQLFQQYSEDNELTFVQDKRLVLKASPSMQFPVRDVEQISHEQDAIIVTCFFMGLYGVDSPLPRYFNEQCLQQGEGGSTLKAFLDAINHRPYALCYMAWRAFHTQCDVVLSAFRKKPKTIACFSQLCRDILPTVPVCVRPFVGAWIECPQPQGLGGDICLGDNILLGQQFYDASGQVQVVLGPVALKDIELFVTSEFIHRLQCIVDNNLLVGTQCELIISIRLDQEDFTLGQSVRNLGLGLVLGYANPAINSRIRYRILTAKRSG